MKRLGDACKVFIAADKCTRVFSKLQWVSLLVHVDEENFLHVLVIKMEGKGSKIQLWWELPLVSIDLLVGDPLLFSKAGQREEDEETTQVVEHVAEGLGGSTIEMLTRELGLRRSDTDCGIDLRVPPLL